MKKFTLIGVIFVMIAMLILQSNSQVVFAQTKLSTNDKASIIMDYYSNEVIYEQNSNEKLQVASIVKLMTTLLTLEEIDKGNISLQDKMVTTENSASMGGSQVFIDPFVEYTVEDMLRSVIIASANDASVALSEHIAGSEENFVLRMNKRAKELGLSSTLYANSTGLPAMEQYSTAKDTALLLKEVIKHDLYFKYSTIWMDELIHPSNRKTELVNTNKLTRYYKGCDGGKTGFTDEAGYCLSATAKRDNLRFIAVSLGAKDSKSRFSNVTTLLNYAFANFENKQIINMKDCISEIKLKMAKESTAQIFAKEDFYVLSKKGEEHKYETTINLPKFLKAPLYKGESVGKIIVTKDGKVIKEIDLTVSQDYPNLKYKDAFEKIVANWN